MDLTQMTEQEQVQYFTIQDDLAANRTMEEGPAAAYAAVCIERARAYQAKISTLAVPLYLTQWAMEMAAKTGKARVKAHHNYLPWLAAQLMGSATLAADLATIVVNLVRLVGIAGAMPGLTQVSGRVPTAQGTAGQAARLEGVAGMGGGA